MPPQSSAPSRPVMDVTAPPKVPVAAAQAHATVTESQATVPVQAAPAEPSLHRTPAAPSALPAHKSTEDDADKPVTIPVDVPKPPPKGHFPAGLVTATVLVMLLLSGLTVAVYLQTNS